MSFPTDLKVSGTTIENANLRVTVDPTTGCITSLFNKKANFETLATAGPARGVGLVRTGSVRTVRWRAAGWCADEARGDPSCASQERGGAAGDNSRLPLGVRFR